MQRLFLSLLLALAAFAGPALAQLSLTHTYLKPPPRVASDHFGHSVAGAGNRVLVGAPEDDTAGPNAGAAYLFDATTGSLLLTFLNPFPNEDDLFGYTVAMVGDNVLIGAPFKDTATLFDAGAAYLFDGTTGLLLQTFVDPSPDHDEQFGIALASLGGNVLIGSPFDNTGAEDAGAAYLFDAGTGALLRTFANPTPAAGDEFGMAIAGVGNNVLVGAPSDDALASNSGVAHLFDGNTGSLIFTITNPTPAASDFFGRAVAASNTNLIVAAPSDDTGAGNAGAVYLFNGATGALLQTFLHPSPAIGDGFGNAVAGVGSSGMILIGTAMDDPPLNSGSAFLFDAASNTVVQTFSNPTPLADDNFGAAVAGIGNNVLIGAPNHDEGANNTGAAYFYASPNSPPIANAGTDQTLECTSPAGTSATLDGSGSTDPDNDQLTYTWRESGNIIAGPSTAPTAVVTFAHGSHTIELTVDDGNGEIDTDEVLITVEDTTPPTITLNGVNPMTLECSAPYEEPGATVSDACDPAPGLVITGTVNPNVTGTYLITYTATDASGNEATATRTVNVIADATPPTITLNGANPMALECHAGSYTEPGAVVSDACDPSPALVISGTVNTDAAGTYTITYTATDASGNSASATRTVNVVDTTPPVITPKSPVVFDSNNHSYTTITQSMSVKSITDGCAGSISISQAVITKVTSDEPEDVYGWCDGYTCDDIVILADCKSVKVRKERKCNGNGRVYTIHWKVSDPSGNVGTAVSKVEIRICDNHPAGDNGPAYTVNSNCAGPGKSSLTESPGSDEESAAVELPEGYAVSQNYPNPFNPTTEIAFALPEAQRVQVTIFNALGEEIRTLADREYAAGEHAVRWNARNDRGERVPSGVYFYRVSSSDFSVTKRMVLAK